MNVWIKSIKRLDISKVCMCVCVCTCACACSAAVKHGFSDVQCPLISTKIPDRKGRERETDTETLL